MVYTYNFILRLDLVNIFNYCDFSTFNSDGIFVADIRKQAKKIHPKAKPINKYHLSLLLGCEDKYRSSVVHLNMCGFDIQQLPEYFLLIEDNMSDYCRNSAPVVFENLIQKLNVRYIAVTYNNTYASKSTSSQNKITLDQILNILEKRGTTRTFDMPYRFFNSGKTEFADHKEFLFITEVSQ